MPSAQLWLWLLVSLIVNIDFWFRPHMHSYNYFYGKNSANVSTKWLIVWSPLGQQWKKVGKQQVQNNLLGPGKQYTYYYFILLSYYCLFLIIPQLFWYSCQFISLHQLATIKINIPMTIIMSCLSWIIYSKLLALVPTNTLSNQPSWTCTIMIIDK